MPVSFGRHVLLARLAEIVHLHPELRLSLSFNEATSNVLLEDIDLAVRFGAIKSSSHLVARHLMDSPRAIVASPGYLNRHGRPNDLAGLKGHRGIAGMGNGPQDWFVHDGDAVHRVVPIIAYRASNGEAIVDMAVAGLGLCQMPVFMLCDALADGRLEAVLPEFPSVPVPVHLVCAQRRHLSPRVRYVVDRLLTLAAAGQLD